tara:strand:+ start:629 stop:811 length:183 start_codon:yes stop_codon:yes gene_type:complete
MKLSIQTIKDYFRSKKKKKKDLIFFEEIGNQRSSKEEIMKNLVKILEQKGFKYKGNKYKD